ncbi:50S ribosomal protein L35 [candidate division WOR-1 bacterium RIFCSPHIGHO2_01_FULL_53_15]|uniref:Large ribosomal subunit protein bL35 n=1 Tax=candidate division WOR-1 bacterium RIFCSPHIGHO2_01_FULL_53_15 TaxID=1802564 RepID=A0A1F4Q016_UNCSA|nr:MAG: 50S ribosomal protein L35 [candidate division WOR-1 bacterium RIFCSPHIGHO2_01_FULL_53_15]OGC12893.1 MAG: 50S ribosomal protein L35 [candidate division WOR-1 bacterium RIFCSPHIGHO2_02_FULL_53_26]
MPKIKTRKAAAKRFIIKKSGTIMRRHAKLRHLLEWKSTSQRRRLKRKSVVSPADETRIRVMLPGGANG